MVEKLKQYINNQGLKKSKVAELLECSSGHLSYVLNGHRDISPEMEKKIRQLIS